MIGHASDKAMHGRQKIRKTKQSSDTYSEKTNHLLRHESSSIRSQETKPTVLHFFFFFSLQISIRSSFCILRLVSACHTLVEFKFNRVTLSKSLHFFYLPFKVME